MANRYTGTQTEKNLMAAFAGESEARNKYTYFASKAKKEGFEQIAALFLKTAENEKEHAKLWFKELEGIGSTAENLAARIDEVDEAVRVAMRVMEERVTLVERMALDARRTGRTAVAELYETRAEEYRRYANTLRDAAITSLRLGRAPREQDI